MFEALGNIIFLDKKFLGSPTKKMEWALLALSGLIRIGDSLTNFRKA